MHQRSWLAVKPIRKSSPPPATPPMLGSWLQAKQNKKDKITVAELKSIANKYNVKKTIND